MPLAVVAQTVSCIWAVGCDVVRSQAVETKAHEVDRDRAPRGRRRALPGGLLPLLAPTDDLPTVIRRNLALGLWGLESTAGVSHEGAL
jgi:hypothetical protein